MYTTRQVALCIAAAGIKVQKYAPMTSECDGEVTITDRLSVQVGLDYMNTTLLLADGRIQFGEVRTNLSEILADVKNLA